MDKKDAAISKIAGAARKLAATATGYTGIFATLQKEHGEVSTLMSQLRRTDASDDSNAEYRGELFRKIRMELLAHASAEEATFYSSLKARAETLALIQSSIDEHQTIDDLLEELTRLGTESLIFDSRFRDLVAAVNHHIDEEETQLFPKAKDALSAEEISRLDDTFKNHKRTRLQHLATEEVTAPGLRP